MIHAERHILNLLRHAAAATEDALDRARHRLWTLSGRHRPRQIAAYCGYADPGQVHVSGRVLANRAGGGPLASDGFWKNLLNTYRRWETDEIAGEPVRLRFGTHEIVVKTDEEGYYHATFPAIPTDHNTLIWQSVAVSVGDPGCEIEATHEVMVTPANARFGIISDLDDTVIHTGITSVLLAAKLTFLENARTRKPLDGAAALYSALRQGPHRQPVNPIFYLSSSPWNLYDLLVDFLRLNDIPPGPLILRDIGLDRTKFIKDTGHGHKLRNALTIIDAFPKLGFVLIGDSAQEDPAIYAEIARQRPGRIPAIYIRDVDPDRRHARLVPEVERAQKLAAAFGVPMVLAADSAEISRHASQLGLILPETREQVDEDVASDRELPDTGVQAIRDALDSVLPGDPAT
jgi:phosphatidate phosphatase APP1